MALATLTSKGQVTIPKAIREAAHLDTGDQLAFLVRSDDVIELRPETVDLGDLVGLLKPKIRGVSIEQMSRAGTRSAISIQL